MFYSNQAMRMLGLLGPLDPIWFYENQIVGCPNPQVPSDHIPLLVEYELKLGSDDVHLDCDLRQKSSSIS